MKIRIPSGGGIGQGDASWIKSPLREFKRPNRKILNVGPVSLATPGRKYRTESNAPSTKKTEGLGTPLKTATPPTFKGTGTPALGIGMPEKAPRGRISDFLAGK